MNYKNTELLNGLNRDGPISNTDRTGHSGQTAGGMNSSDSGKDPVVGPCHDNP
jgi:hypothetical protein